MRQIRKIFFYIIPFILITWFILSHHQIVMAGSPPSKGTAFPEIELIPPTSTDEINYLGISKVNNFSISEIKGKALIVEIVGVYCPQCHIQLPLFRKLFHRVKKNPKLFESTKFLAIAVGANSNEVEYLKKQFQIPYPVIVDPEFAAHRKLGEPRTPYTMLLSEEKKVAYVHVGVMKDLDLMYKKISQLIR